MSGAFTLGSCAPKHPDLFRSQRSEVHPYERLQESTACVVERSSCRSVEEIRVIHQSNFTKEFIADECNDRAVRLNARLMP